MHISELDTPALLIDLDVMERNLQRMAEYTRTHGLRLRPHTKTHKIPAIGRQQLARGAVGLTVAKVSEAEVMAATGTPDLLVAYPLVGAQKLRRLAALPVAVTVAVDSREVVEPLATLGREVGVLAEIDVGLSRVGVDVGAPLLDLVREIARHPFLRFDGIAFYPGHIKHLTDEGQAQLRLLSDLLEQAVDLLTKAGFPPRIVSGGSTPTMWESHAVSCLNEIRPGTYVFNDLNTVASGACEEQDCAASVLVTVVSTARPQQMIVDGGSKTFSSDRLHGATAMSFGRVQEAPEAVFGKMNEEHGFINTRDAGRAFAVGERVRIVPNHICVAMNLHEQVYGIRGEQVEEVWRVEGRGKLQ